MSSCLSNAGSPDGIKSSRVPISGPANPGSAMQDSPRSLQLLHLGTAASLSEQFYLTAHRALFLQLAQPSLEHLQRHARAMSTVFERAKDELTLRPCKHQARLAAPASSKAFLPGFACRCCVPAPVLLCRLFTCFH